MGPRVPFARKTAHLCAEYHRASFFVSSPSLTTFPSHSPSGHCCRVYAPFPTSSGDFCASSPSSVSTCPFFFLLYIGLSLTYLLDSSLHITSPRGPSQMPRSGESVPVTVPRVTWTAPDSGWTLCRISDFPSSR